MRLDNTIPLVNTDPSVQSVFSKIINWWNSQDNGSMSWTRMFAGNSNSAISPHGTVFINGSFGKNLVTKTANYTLSDLDNTVFVDSTGGAVTITLPTASGIPGRQYSVKDWKGQSATNNITIATSASQKIDGASTYVLNIAYSGVTVVSDGSNWGVVPLKLSAAFTTPTIQRFTSGSGTYTLPTNPSPIYIRVKIVGGGGGGSGSGTAGAGNGGNGGNSTFGATLVAGGGTGGTFQANGPAGGTNTTAGTVIQNVTGGSGGGFLLEQTSGGGQLASGIGGSTPLSGGARSGSGNNAGQSGGANTGEGGQGGATGATGANNYGGCGGGGGGYLDVIFSSPSATYAYAVGALGTNGTAGTNGNAGGNGGSGLIVVEEYYQ